MMRANWKSDACEFFLMLALSPIWLPTMLGCEVLLFWKTRPMVRGRVEDAWDLCAKVWRDRGQVCQFCTYDMTAFEHELAVALARQHRSKRKFFLERVGDPDPILAAYAFKCLIRFGELSRRQMPPGAFQRLETIVVHVSDLPYEQTLGSFFEGWFRQQEFLPH